MSVRGRKKTDLAPFFMKYRKYLSAVRWLVMDFWEAFTSTFSRMGHIEGSNNKVKTLIAATTSTGIMNISS